VITAAFTLTDLVDQALEEGIPATERRAKEWVGKGLLDRAHERGRGRRLGLDRTWPEAQRDLWLDLLRRLPARDRELTHMPVGRWLLMGSGVIPIRQVRRALATWASPTGKPSTRSSKAVALDLLLRFQRDGARQAAWRGLVAYTAEVLHRDSVAAAAGLFQQTGLDRKRSLALFRRVVPSAASYDDAGHVLLGASPDYAVHLLDVQLNALGEIAYARTLDRRGRPHDGHLDWLDESLERARLVCLLNNNPNPVALGHNQVAFPPGAFEQDACLRLLPSLGMELRHPSD
jgi:hypothetical protein